MKRKIFVGVIIACVTLVAIIFFLIPNKSDNRIKIGVFLFTHQQVIEEINIGFKNKILKYSRENQKKIKIIEKNANGDQMQMDLISNYFINGEFDMIFVVGAPAIKILKDKNCTTPVVFGGPPDPVSYGIVTSLKGHNSYFTGTTYFPPTDIILELFLSLYNNAKTIAVLRNPAEPNSVAVGTSFINHAKNRGITIVDLPSTDGAQIDASMRSLSSNRVDGLFIPTDNLVYSMLDRVIMGAEDLNIPTFSCTKLSVEKGVLFSIGTDYQTVGELSADVAAQIIFQNIIPQDIDVYEINRGKIYVNAKKPLHKMINGITNYEIEVIQ